MIRRIQMGRVLIWRWFEVQREIASFTIPHILVTVGLWGCLVPSHILAATQKAGVVWLLTKIVVASIMYYFFWKLYDVRTTPLLRSQAVQTGRGGSPKLILGFGGFLTAGHRGGWGGGQRVARWWGAALVACCKRVRPEGVACRRRRRRGGGG
jgi:hypothetical protein